jgi:pilus assembly protein CpaB
MKNTRTWVILSVAIVSGLLAVLLAGRWLDRQSHSDITQVVVARTEISLGQRLAPEMLKLVDWPKNSLPPGVHLSTEKLDGRVLKAGLQRGEPVLEAKLAPQGTQGGLSAVIAEGKRAITVRVNDVIGVAGFALPGNYVDIIVNTQKDGERVNHDQNISKIVLEKILVLAVAQEVSRDETRPRVVNAVTLEVTPEEAEKIDLARSVGSLSLVLRNQVDPNPIRTAGITKNDLLSIQNGGLKSDSVVVSNPKVNVPVVRKKPNQSNPIQIARSSSVPTASTLAPEPSAECVGVLTGLRSSSECY